MFQLIDSELHNPIYIENTVLLAQPFAISDFYIFPLEDFVLVLFFNTQENCQFITEAFLGANYQSGMACDMLRELTVPPKQY